MIKTDLKVGRRPDLPGMGKPKANQERRKGESSKEIVSPHRPTTPLANSGVPAKGLAGTMAVILFFRGPGLLAGPAAFLQALLTFLTLDPSVSFRTGMMRSPHCDDNLQSWLCFGRTCRPGDLLFQLLFQLFYFSCSASVKKYLAKAVPNISFYILLPRDRRSGPEDTWPGIKASIPD